MIFTVGIAVTVLVLLMALARRRRTERPIDVGNVSTGWLAEFKLGKREANWH